MLPNTDVARGTGYELVAANPVNTAQDLPQKIAVLAEVNTANQAVSTVPVRITSRAQAAGLYGWGSPMDMAMRILLPQNGGGVNGAEVWAFPVLAAVASVAQVQTITVTGSATGSTTLNILIAGRGFLEGGSYKVSIPSGYTPTQTATAIKNAINAVLGCPYAATSSVGVVTLTANWTGLSSNDLTVVMVPGPTPMGVSYAVTSPTAGSGMPTNIPTVLAQMDVSWFTLVVTGWSLAASNSSVLAQYIAFNGNPNAQTGRWSPLIMKPSQYLVGNLVDSTTSSTDTVESALFLNDLTFAFCPTPLSLGMPVEGAANYCVNVANVFNNTPNIDIQNIPLPDMPGILPGGTPPQQSSNYTMRNAIIALGMSTIIYNNGIYYPQDFVTTYNPVGLPTTYRYPRCINIDMNVEYKWRALKTSVIGNKQIAADNDTVSAPNVVKPKDVKAAMYQFSKDLVDQGFTTDATAMQASVFVNINATNRDRFDIGFTYNRSGVARVVSNVATVNP